MTPQNFQSILERVQSLITKQTTNFRKPIGPAERLQLTLRYIATGDSQTSLSLLFRIKQSTVSKILEETIGSIYNVLYEEYLKFPDSQEEWLQIAKDFQTIWGFPNCLGAIDGKHCTIRGMRKAGSTYYNYKGNHSIILMAIVDARYRFKYVQVGTNGRVGDAGLVFKSELKYDIEKGVVKIPPSDFLPKSEIKYPYVFVADDAFSLEDYMMKPFSHNNLSRSQQRYNYMLSRSRRVVENAFGILANRSRVLKKIYETAIVQTSWTSANVMKF